MSRARITQLLDQALDYRGFVTVTRHDGTSQVGFVYDLGRTHLEMFDEQASSRIRMALDEIVHVELSGEDCAADAHDRWERRHGTLVVQEILAEAPPPAAGPVLILVALRRELRAVAGALGTRAGGAVLRGSLGEEPVVAVAVGVGGGAAQVIAAERPSLVISCGFAGALDPTLTTGAVVLASSVRDELGESFVVAPAQLRAARRALEARGGVEVVEGEILCTTEVAATGAEKAALVRRGRFAVDLESGPTARAAERAGVPWLAMRVVLDPLDTRLPTFARVPRTGYVAPAMRYGLRGPRAWVELAGLGIRARTASRTLALVVERLGAAFGSLSRSTVARPEPAA